MKKSLLSIISLLIVCGFRFLPAPVGLSASGMQVIGIFIGVLILWMSVGIDWPSLVCLLALGFVPEIGFNALFSASFGNNTFVFLLFTFTLTYALSQTSFVKRIAIWFVTRSFSQKGPWYLAISFFTSVLVVGLFMSPTVLFFIMLPILEEIYKVLNLKKGSPYAAMLMIGLVTCTSLSSGMTPIAHVFPVLAMGVYETLTGLTISYAGYMGFAIPAGILVFIFMMIIFYLGMNSKIKGLKFTDVSELNQLVDKQSTREKVIICIFMLVVAIWVLPGLGVLKDISKFTPAMPPLLGTLLLAMIKVDHKPLLSLNEAMLKGVSWPALIMVSSTLALGFAITHEGIGLMAFLESAITPLTHQLAPIILVLLFISWAALQSNLSSHMVTAQVVSSLAVPVALSSGNMNAAALACVIGFVASAGSATPPSMPYVAICGASGWTNAKQLAQYGFMIMLGVILIGVFIAYPLAARFLA